MTGATGQTGLSGLTGGTGSSGATGVLCMMFYLKMSLSTPEHCFKT